MRGHLYVRYADDCRIYLKSEASAKRVAESIINYIEEKLLLKVNREKTKISRPRKHAFKVYILPECKLFILNTG